jgi:dihydroorotate dehydrogenase electron transfer subunit
MSSIVNRGATTTVQGRSQGPLRAQCEVLAYRRIGDYHSLTFVAPEMAERAQAGQFERMGQLAGAGDGGGGGLRAHGINP